MSDSEDEMPLAQRAAAVKAAPAAGAPAANGSVEPSAAAAGPANGVHEPKAGGTSAPAAAAAAAPTAGAKRLAVVLDEESDDDIPLGNRMPQPKKPAAAPAAAAKPAPAAAAAAKPSRKPAALDDAVMLPTAPRPKPKPVPVKKEEPQSDSDADSDVPLAVRRQSLSGADKKPSSRVKKEGGDKEKKPAAKRKSAGGGGSQAKRAKSEQPQKTENGTEKKWDTLRHAGVLFPPEYEPHGVKMLYDSVPVDLTPAQEEVATFFAVMKETDYMKKPQFIKNFWEGFQEVLGPRHVIKDLEKCDFTPIYDWQMAEREKKKQLSKEEKARLKKEKDEAEAKYKVALVDGREEPVGNFRVEMPGLFRGRGEHPKMGKIKRRVYPRDITINIGHGEPIPTHPFPGQQWKEIRHDNTVTWLAMWKDPVNIKETKYVWLGATSSWKAESDLQKYEKARKLKDYIDDIRATYTKNWTSKDRQEQQMATALYFIDKLALRAGHEKDEDEADTVGCCTLKVENVSCQEANHIEFDFLGKDSIRYLNKVKVEPQVYKNVQLFLKEDRGGQKKGPSDQLFDAMDATDLNKRLKDLMDGLSVKVFRTYNASIVLDRLLSEESESVSVDEKRKDYDFANKEVAILCNHQRAVPKSHDNTMQKIRAKVEALQQELSDLHDKLSLVKKGKKKDEEGNNLPAEDRLHNMIEKKKDQIMRAELDAEKREELKTVALGTSKINYLDPRITVAWCKRMEVPIEKVFNKSLLNKFLWAMDAEPGFRF